MAGASVLFIVASVISFCLKTHPGFRVEILPVLERFAIDQNVSAPAAATTADVLAPAVVMPPHNAYYAKLTTTTTTSTTTTTTTTQMPPTPQALPRINGGVPSRNRISTRYSSYVGDGWQETYGQPHEAFFYVELVCNVWFFVELIIRFVVSLVGCLCRCL